MDERIARQHLSPAFGDRELADMSRCEVEAGCIIWQPKGWPRPPATVSLPFSKSICSLAVTHGSLQAGQTPCLGVPPLKIHTLRERYLTPDEAWRLIRALEESPRPEAAALCLLLLTGARKSEILKARWENVRLDQRLLIVPLSKSNKPRHIPLSAEAVAVIRSIRREPDCPWLFPGYAPGKPLSDLYTFWNQLRRELGIADVASMICGIPLPVFWSMPGIRSTRFKNYWDTAIPGQPYATPFWGRPRWLRPRKP